MKLSDYTNYLIKTGVSPTDGYKYLASDNYLSLEQKKLIYAYCYPRHLLDRELPNHVKNYLNQCGNSGKGWLTPDHGESCLFVEAFRSKQYGRFMKHLMHAFLDPDKVNACGGTGEEYCPLCGKKLYLFDTWKGINDPEQEELAIMSRESSVCLCKDCLVQLVNTNLLLEELEGENYLKTVLNQ